MVDFIPYDFGKVTKIIQEKVLKYIYISEPVYSSFWIDNIATQGIRPIITGILMIITLIRVADFNQIKGYISRFKYHLVNLQFCNSKLCTIVFNCKYPQTSNLKTVTIMVIV